MIDLRSIWTEPHDSAPCPAALELLWLEALATPFAYSSTLVGVYTMMYAVANIYSTPFRVRGMLLQRSHSECHLPCRQCVHPTYLGNKHPSTRKVNLSTLGMAIVTKLLSPTYMQLHISHASKETTNDSTIHLLLPVCSPCWHSGVPRSTA
jgi:hypothetical protein